MKKNYISNSSKGNNVNEHYAWNEHFEFLTMLNVSTLIG